MYSLIRKNFPKLNELKLAVIGHIEWVTFLKVDHLAQAGIISHASKEVQLPAGGGAVTAIKLAKLTKRKVDFYTALGKDELGIKCSKILKNYNLNLYIGWKDDPTRRGISMIDHEGERAITVIGKRVQPSIQDDIPWGLLGDYDGIFITACDRFILNECGKAKKVIATPRVGLEVLNKTDTQLHALIGSNLDPTEKKILDRISKKPQLLIKTEGENGGNYHPGGEFKPVKVRKALVDTYGCGDSFAAGVTAGLAADYSAKESILIGAKCGAECATYFGPYENSN